MKTRLLRIGTLLALVFVALTFVNASWIAKAPRGYVKLIAQDGAAPLPAAREGCGARIEPLLHTALGNSLPGIQTAVRTGAQMVEVDLAPAKDGIALFPDAALECRTNGAGAVKDKTLAELKALDAGYRYTPDGGRSFPFRGKGLGHIPALAEAVQAADTKPLLYHFASGDAAEADALAAALKAAGRDPVALGDGFYGADAPVARIRRLYPKAWAWSPASAARCSADYRLMGWLAITPESCRNGTLVIPIDSQWAYAGWPNRLIARMEAVGARVLVVAGAGEGTFRGLDLPEQLGEIPSTFNGYVWVDDIWTVGPALRPAFSRRSAYEEQRLAEVLEARRKARD